MHHLEEVQQCCDSLFLVVSLSLANVVHRAKTFYCAEYQVSEVLTEAKMIEPINSLHASNGNLCGH